MGFESIMPGGNPAPASAPVADPKPSPAANNGSVSMDDALKGADHTKHTIFSVSDLSKGASGSAGSGPVPGSVVTAGQLVSGKIAVDMMDAMLPAILVVAFAKMGLSIKKTGLQLTQAEKNTLAPYAEACLNTINMNFSNPWQALAISVIFIYGGKALELGGVGWLEKKANETKPADPNKYDKPIPEPKQTPIVPMGKPIAGQGVAGVKQNVPVDRSNDQMDFSPLGPTTWTEADVLAVEKKRKRGRKEALAWLEKNWTKKGGIL